MTKISEALNLYHFHLLKFSESHQSWAMQHLKVFEAWAEDERIELEQIKPHVMSRYLEHLRKTPITRTGKPRAAATLHNYMGAQGAPAYFGDSRSGNNLCFAGYRNSRC